MTNFSATLLRFLAAAAVFFAALIAIEARQNRVPENSASLGGRITDVQSHPIGGAAISLQSKDTGKVLNAISDASGRYRFANLASGTYRLQVKEKGWHDASKEPVVLEAGKEIVADLQLEQDMASGAGKGAAPTLEFSVEPSFTVAGVTDPTNLGGHGSESGTRTRESLARATAGLNSADIAEEKKRAAELRNAPDSAELHELLGDIAESEGRSLEAVREYERAAKMAPSEANLFAWGAELLLHRALEPAAEVFARGHELFPRSARMLVGLGVSSYDLGRFEEASRHLAAACDIDPADPTPYSFLGKIQAAEKSEPRGWTERLKRFAELQPENALAHYYYAVALSKDGTAGAALERVESSLLSAVKLDPKLADAYLQLGILYTARNDTAKAIDAYQRAIEAGPSAGPSSAEAHFRLAAAYRLSGETAKARREIEIYDQLAKQRSEKSERERHEIQEFVYTLRGQGSRSDGSRPQD